VAEHIPLAETKCLAQCDEVPRVMLDARRAHSWRRLRRAAAALIVENELPPLRERGKRRPEQSVIVDEASVHAHQRSRASDLRGLENSKLEPPRLHPRADESRGTRERPAVSDERMQRGGNGGDERLAGRAKRSRNSRTRRELERPNSPKPSQALPSPPNLSQSSFLAPTITQPKQEDSS
jgi:hypothetical protein